MAQPAIPRTLLEGEDRGRWPIQGQWTYKDYLRLPEDGNRYEVIRGSLYVTAAPIFDHQFAVLKLSRYLDEFVSAGELGVVLAAPFDVLLPFGIGAPVQPDILVFRAGNEPSGGDKNFVGVPDLIAEVLSPGTRRRDRTVKLGAYQAAKVPEYWLVDPLERTVAVYGLGPGMRYTELCRGVEGDRVRSFAFPGFDLAVTDLFPRRK